MKQAFIVSCVCIICWFSCSSKLASDREFESYLKKFRSKELPFFIHSRDSFRVYDDFILEGSSWVNNVYPNIDSSEIKFLPTFPKAASNVEVKNRAIFNLKT